MAREAQSYREHRVASVANGSPIGSGYTFDLRSTTF